MFIAAVRFMVAAVEPDAFPCAKCTDPFVDVTLILPLPTVDRSDAPVTLESRVKVMSDTEVTDDELRISDGAVSDRTPSLEVTTASESSS